MGGERLGKILRHVLEDPSRWSGFPDCVVWRMCRGRGGCGGSCRHRDQVGVDGVAGEVRLVEVKSQNDTLSSAQVRWLMYLKEIGVSSEVLRVNYRAR